MQLCSVVVEKRQIYEMCNYSLKMECDLTTNCVTKLRDSESYTLSTVITLIFPISLNTTTTTLCDTTKRRIHHLMGFPIVRRYENDKSKLLSTLYSVVSLSFPTPTPIVILQQSSKNPVCQITESTALKIRQ